MNERHDIMEQRKSRRFVITLNTSVIIGDLTYKGVIGNVSEEGLLTSLTTYIETDESFIPQKHVVLNFDLPSGETVELSCEVRWFLKPQENGKTLMMGLYAIDPPPEYILWVNKFK